MLCRIESQQLPRLHIAERSRCLAGSLAGFHCQMCRSRVSVDSLVMEVFGRTLETKLRHDFAPALPALAVMARSEVLSCVGL